MASRPARRSSSPAGSSFGMAARLASGSSSNMKNCSRTIVREQFFMLLLEPEASLAAIPKLLPAGEDERRAGLDAIRSVLSASAEISGEAARRLDRVTGLFGLAGEPQAKAS